MRRFLFFLLLAAGLCSCATGRYGRGPESRDIERLPGYIERGPRFTMGLTLKL